jgi:DHA1 family tetracycline resistance protein-like MFS transporter
MSPLFTLFLFVLIDVLGFSLVLPLFPYLRKDFGMSYTTLGYLQASNAVAQLISVPIIGSLSDKYGRKPLLIVCVIGTMISFVMFAMADSVWMLFASRILDGVLGGNISLAQAYISGALTILDAKHHYLSAISHTYPLLTLPKDTTNAESRTKGMGMLGAAFGLGFIVGPATGGILAKYHQSWPSWIAAFLSLINLFCVFFFLPESRPQGSEKQQSSAFWPAMGTIKEIVQTPRLSGAMLLRLGHSIVFTIFELWFGYFTSDRLGLSTQHSSYLLTLYGIVYSMVQATAIRTLVHKYQETKILAVVLHLLAITYGVAYFSNGTLMFALILVPLGILSGVSNTLVSSLVSKLVSPERVGGALGFSAALGSLSRIIAPTLTSYMSETISLNSPPVACALISFLLVLLQSFVRAEAAESQTKDQVKPEIQSSKTHNVH